jgi:HrpA-like RNA helicase
MIMNDHGSEAYIICTQPRRIAAITVAERVALERGEGVGNTVGYQVRLNSRLGDNTRIIYCTTGVLLRRLQQDGFLAGVSHILVDEVHERQTDTDFLMALLSRKLESYPHLRVILMSATLQETLFSDYFKCPIVYVRGRTFPVELHYLPEVLTLVAAGQNVVANERGKQHNAQMTPQKKAIQTFEMHIGRGSEVSKAKLPKFDPEIVAEVIIRLVQRYSEKTVVSTGVRSEATTGDAVLCFLSGIQAITNVERALRRRSLDSLNAVCYTLHGSLPSEYQKRVFRPTRPGEWKIILSTNIAETSVTVDDVTHVVDCGLHKEMRFDATANVSSLQEVPVSRAAARQRAGRAGRVRAGHCWRLYTETFFNGDVIEEYSVPEIRRVPLEEVVLQVLLLNLGLPEIFLGSCIEPPSREQVRRSVQTLLEIKAVLPLPSLPLTALGFHLAKLTVDVHLGKMLIVGALLNVLEPVLTIAAALGGRSPFLSPPNQRDQAAAAHRRFKVENFSDHLAIVSAYDAWCKVREGQGPTKAYAFCQTHYLAANTMNEISLLREHFRQYLRDAGFIAKLAGDGDAMEGRDEVVSGVEEKEKEQNGKLDDVMSDAISTNGEIISPISTRVTNDLVRCALTAGLFPQIVRACRYLEKAKVDAKGKGRQDMLPIHLLQADGKEVSLHPMSLCCRDLPSVFESRDGSRSREAYLVYYTKVASTKLFLHDCSSVPLPAILLFGGDLTISKSRDRVIVDTWIQLKSSELHAVLYKRLQREIEGLLISKVETPDADLADRQGILIAVLSKLLE